ncbi:MAG TPA: 2-oxo acid dehydrogenase subunit E2 [Clostridia bacterium]|nr:2-oxo acid dehydrogenase subunit E2 [Clostridia bacterium]
MDIVMPKLGIMLKGKIVKWLKAEGDYVQAGEGLFTIETEKVTHTVRSPVSGVVVRILHPQGSVVPVGQVVAIIQEGEAATVHVPADEERGIAARTVMYSIPLEGVKGVTAHRMLESSRKSPRAAVGLDILMDEAISIRKRMADAGKKISLTDLVIWAVSRSLEANRVVNSVALDDCVQVFEQINVGFAVDTPKGLMVPVIPEANKKEVTEIAALRADLTKRVQEFSHSETDITGGTFTVSNLGTLGIDRLIPIVNPGEAAILGVGRIGPRAIVRGGAVGIGQVMEVWLAFDHRAINGAEAARFLADLKNRLEDPKEGGLKE